MSTFTFVYCTAIAVGATGLLWILRGCIVDRWNIPFLEKRWEFPTNAL